MAGAELLSKLDALREKAPPPQVGSTMATNKGFEGTDLSFLRTVGEWMETRQP